MFKLLWKTSVFILILVFAGTPARAGDVKVIKVFVIKTIKLNKTSSVLYSNPNLDSLEISVPTDDEMKAARQAIEAMNIKPDNLPEEGNFFTLETFMFQVKRALPELIGKEAIDVNGIPVEKSTDDDLDKQRELLKTLRGFMHFFDPFELQLALGGGVPLTYDLAHSYHDCFSITFGLGYQFSRNFSLLLNLDGNLFNSSNDGLNQGFSLQEGIVELLGKFRFASKNVRPYIFAGQAIGFSDFTYNFSNNSNYNNLSVYNYGSTMLSDRGHFEVVGGLGIEIPITTYHLFIQAEVIDDFVGSNVSNFATLDQPIIFMPIEAGIVFGQ